MSWSGYFSLGDDATEAEIINVARTEAYAANAGLTWFKPVYNSALLPTLLGDAQYISPALDNAPWYDEDDPASNEFFGLYPLSVTGLEDSTRSSVVVESTLDGGIPGRLRYGTKTSVFAGALIASSERGVDYGFRWLDRVTKKTTCLPSLPNFTGHTLHYLSLDPSLDPGCAAWVESTRALLDGGYWRGEQMIDTDTPVVEGGTPSGTGTLVFDGGTPSETGGIIYTSTPPFEVPDAYSPALETYWRSMHKFKINAGPRILAKHSLSGGGAVWNVQMTGVAGTPWEFGRPKTIVQDFNATTGAPYPASITDGVYDQDGVVYVDVPCSEPVWEPVYSPYCPAIVTPPTTPVVSALCFDLPLNWWRRYASIPREFVPLWGDAVPVIQVTAGETDEIMMRIVIYADAAGTGRPADNECAILGDYVISYVPAGMTLVLDGVAQAVYVIDPSTNVQRRADNLVAKSDGSPFDWVALSCGYGYTVAIDTRDDADKPVVDVALVPRLS